MKISFITAMALGGAMLSTAPAAYAGSSMGYHSGSSHTYGHIGDTADCPPGTSRSGDGTCMMHSGGSMGGSYYGGTSAYSSGSTVTTYGSIGETADCPPGTSRSGDGTCLMSSGGSMGMGSSSMAVGSSSMGHTSRTYGGSSSSYMAAPSYSSSSSYTPSTSYSSSYRSSSSNCPAGSTRAADGVCMSNTPSTSYSGSSSYSSYSSSSPSTSSYSYSSTPLNSYQRQSSYVVDNTVTSTMSDSEADYRYGSGSISQTYTDGSNTIVPFTTTSATLSNYRVPGMGANEYLSATDCPVNVYNPSGAKVLGCYKVSKPAPVRVSVPNYHHVRVVRPIIYVRYPVPVAVPMHTGWHQTSYQHHNGWARGGNWGHGSACNAGWNSRYGQNWPGSCGW